MNRWAKYLVGSARFGLTLLQRPLGKIQSRPMHGYIGYLGRGNVGDEAIFRGLRHLRPDVTWLPSVRSGWGITRKAPLWLDSPRFLQTVALGGGTLISSGQARHWVEELLRLGQVMWCCGTGVGSAGWTQQMNPDLGAWRDTLNKFRGIAVRGPSSKARLEAIGVDRVEVCGDLALALVLDKLLSPANPPILALNVSLPLHHDDPVNTEHVLDILVSVAKRWRRQGGRILPLAMDQMDLVPLAKLCQQIDLDSRHIQYDLDPGRVIHALARCSALVGVRLHSAVLAICAGVAPVLLGYREKCRDFMLSMGLEDAYISLLNVDPGSIIERIESLVHDPPVERDNLLDQARHWAELQKTYITRMIDG